MGTAAERGQRLGLGVEAGRQRDDRSGLTAQARKG